MSKHCLLRFVSLLLCVIVIKAAEIKNGSDLTAEKKNGKVIEEMFSSFRIDVDHKFKQIEDFIELKLLKVFDKLENSCNNKISELNKTLQYELNATRNDQLNMFGKQLSAIEVKLTKILESKQNMPGVKEQTMNIIHKKDLLQNNNLSNEKPNETFNSTKEIVNTMNLTMQTLETNKTIISNSTQLISDLKEQNLNMIKIKDVIVTKLLTNDTQMYSLNQTYDLNKRIFEIVENINHTLKTLGTEINKKLESAHQIPSLTEQSLSMSKKLDMLEMKILSNDIKLQNLNYLFENVDRKIVGSFKPFLNSQFQDLEKSINTNNNCNKTIDSSKDFKIRTDIVLKNISDIMINNQYRMLCRYARLDQPCKFIQVKGNHFKTKTYYSMDNKTLNHVMLYKNIDKVKYFEINMKIKGDNITILLSSQKDLKKNYFRIVLSSKNTQHISKIQKRIKTVNKTGFISNNAYTAIYIKISEGKMLVGKQGEAPMLVVADADLQTLNYFNFACKGKDDVTYIYFDCPVA